MATVQGTSTFAIAPSGSSAPDSITKGGGSIWVEYGNGADSTGKSGSSTIVQYDRHGMIENTYTLSGLADGLKYDPRTGDVWALMNNDGNSHLVLIDPATKQVSAPLNYAPPYVYGTNSSRGYDDAVFDGKRVFVSYTNPANPGDPVVQELTNGTAPFGTLHTTDILRLGDTGTNLVTGQHNQPLPMTDPDSLKLLPNGSLVLTSEADGALIFIKDPGTTNQSESFVKLPAGMTPDDAIMPTASSGTFYISNQGGNDVVAAKVSGLNPHDLYVDVRGTTAAENALVQLDPRTGQVTTLVSGLNSPHGLLFVPSHASGSEPSDLHDEAGKHGLLADLIPGGGLPSPSFLGEALRGGQNSPLSGGAPGHDAAPNLLASFFDFDPHHG